MNLRLLPLAVLFALATVLGLALLRADGENMPRQTDTATPMPSLHLAAVTEGEAPLDTTTLAGKPYFLNVFASWCAPCLAEHALLMKLRAQSGIAIYGISWKDTPEATRRWLQAHGNPYTFAGYDPAGKAAIALGITGVPESFLVNAEGEIVWHWPGPLTEEIVEDTLLPRIKELRQ